jgi:hypothetical protein
MIGSLRPECDLSAIFERDRTVIVWLASYPRSGNTMLRAMLRQAFGADSYSMYDDPTDIGMVADVGREVGHKALGTSFREFYFRELGSPKPVFVKTHNEPGDTSLAIYIVRDGRSATVSWYNMLIRAKGRTDITLSDVILGRNVAFLDWSSHLRAWNPKHNPRVLLLYYRDLVSQPEAALSKVAAFAGQRQIAPWRDNFAKLHRLYPEFFASGSDKKNIAQLTSAETELFWRTHHKAMREFGFDEKAVQ